MTSPATRTPAAGPPAPAAPGSLTGLTGLAGLAGLAGTPALVRLILRRDRIVTSVWVLVLGLIPASYARITGDLYPTAADRAGYAADLRASSTFRALLGPVYDSSLGALSAWRSANVAAIVALASLLVVIRHTRVEEEAGRRDLLGSVVVGRQAPLAAALSAALGTTLLLAALTALGLVAVGLPVAGSVAFGLSVAALGWLFAALAAVAAQLTEGAGAARGIALSVLGLCFVLRAAGDAAGGGALSWLAWASPVGWGQRVNPYAEQRWWLLVPLLGASAALAATAFALSARRDVGAGVLAARPGPAAASRRLCGPLGLAWRLQRGMLAGWTAGFAVVGAVLGGAAEGSADLFGDNETVRRAVERLGAPGSLVDAYLSSMMGLLALAAAGYATQSALRLRAEEAAMRAEPVLATATGRLRWAGSHLAFAALGPAAALAAAGLAAGLAHGFNSGEVGHQVPRVLGAALAQLPAVWVLGALAAALFGLAPRLVALAWAALAGFVLLGQFGALVDLSQWAQDLSPFTHVPRLPGGDLAGTGPLVLAGLAVALAAAGLAGFGHRDVG